MQDKELFAICHTLFDIGPDGLYYKVTPHPSSRRTAGERAGYIKNDDGYRVVRVKGKKYCEHHLVWLMHHGHMPKFKIDHINRNRDDNHISNLREADDFENAWNRGPAGASSGFKGVSGHCKPGKWVARIMAHGKPYFLGTFKNKFEAAKAYDKKAIELYGDFAYTNFPKGEYK